MGIRVSETEGVLHIPYGPPSDDGTHESTFVDLKANPSWVPVIPPSIGWPETRNLLEAINASESPLMSLAAHQGFASPDQPEFDAVLTSFVTLCYADLQRNKKLALEQLASFLQLQVSELLQAVSNEIERALFLNVLLELQPTAFHHNAFEGWSLTIFMAAYGGDAGDARRTWNVGVRALQDALTDPKLPAC